MTSATPYYGGGHSMRTGSDLVYWALRDTSVYYPTTALFEPPSAAAQSSLFAGYGRIASCISKAGVEIPQRYADLLDYLTQHQAFISPARAMRTRGAILLNVGTVSVSVGDGRRVVYEESFKLMMKYLKPNQEPQSFFEYAAKVPGLEYL